MTVIRPNAISGITSLTAQGDVINFFKSDGTLSGLEIGGARINATGISTFTTIKVGTAQTLDASGINVTGVITATSFKGDGSTLTGVAATSNISTNAIVNSGITTVAAGSAAAPSITPTGDSNTGIFFPAADTIAFGEGGAEAARIDSSGRFGLGTASPDANLDVRGSDASILISDSGRTQYWRIQNQEPSDALTFNANDLNERMRIDSSGRLLVGTATATANGGVLQVSNGITFPATQSACSNVNTLDDYEEGTWTPSVSPSSGSGQSVTVRGEYIKIGKQVTLWGEVIVNSVGTASGGMQITGLPFNVVANDRAVGAARDRATTLATMGSVYSPQNDRLWLVEYDGTTPWFANAYWMFSVAYEV